MATAPVSNWESKNLDSSALSQDITMVIGADADSHKKEVEFPHRAPRATQTLIPWLARATFSTGTFVGGRAAENPYRMTLAGSQDWCEISF